MANLTTSPCGRSNPAIGNRKSAFTEALEPRRLLAFVNGGASTINGQDYQSIDRIVPLPSGYVAAGMFSGRTEFARGTVRTTAEDNTDLFLTLFSGSASATLTIGSADDSKLKFKDDRLDFGALPRRITDTNFPLGVSAAARNADEYVTQLKLGTGGKLYVSVAFRKEISLNTQDANARVLTPNNELEGDFYDSAILRFDISGNTFALEDVKQIGGPFNDVIQDFTFDNTGNLIVAGSFERQADFDPGKKSHVLDPQGRGDAFVAKFGRSGKLQWVSQLGGESTLQNDIESAFSVVAGPDDSVYVGGTIADEAEFRVNGAARREDVAEARDRTDGFTMRLDTNGGLDWIRVQGGDDLDGIRAVTPDNAGGVWSVGYFSDEADLDPRASSEAIFTANDRGDEGRDRPTDAFFTRFDEDGSALFIKPLSGTGFELIGSASTEASGALIITGSFEGTIDFDPSRRTRLVTTADNDDLDDSNGDRDHAYAGFTATYSLQARLLSTRLVTGENGQDVFLTSAQLVGNRFAIAGRYRSGFRIQNGPQVRTNTNLEEYREDGFSWVIGPLSGTL